MTADPQANAVRSMPEQSTSQPVAGSSLHGAVLSHPLVLAIVGLAGAFICWPIIEYGNYPWFQVPYELSNIPIPAPTPMVIALNAAQNKVDYYNLILIAAIMSSLVSAVIGLVEARKHVGMGRATARAVLAGTAGAIFGALAGLASQFTFISFGAKDGNPLIVHPFGTELTIDPMMQLIGVQAAFWCLVGAGAGLGLGIATRSRGIAAKALTGGVIGGLLTAMVYCPLTGFVLPLAAAENILPDSTAGLTLWFLGAAICALFCGIVARSQPRQRRAVRAA